jgi:hypothetical protein
MAEASSVHCVVSTRGSAGVPWYATPRTVSLGGGGIRDNGYLVTFDEELLPVREELGALDGDGWDSIDGSDSDAGESQKGAEGNHGDPEVLYPQLMRTSTTSSSTRIKRSAILPI